MKEVRASNTTFEQDYKLPFSLFKFLLLGFFLIVLAFFYTFPVGQIFSHYVSTALKTNKKCQLQFKNYEFGFFMPNLQFNDVAIPNGCVGVDQKLFIVDKMRVSFGGLNFSPMGAVANLALKIGKNDLELKASSDGKQHVVKLSEQTLNLEPLSDLLANKLGILAPSLLGKADLDLHLKTSNTRLEIFDLNLASKKFQYSNSEPYGVLNPRP